jgi:dihydrofolate synthase / folylpolyglutamate synthase
VLSVVTGVDLDHTEVLGDTVEAIAHDKAGVARAGRPLIVGATGAALEVVTAEADRVGAAAWVLERARWTGRTRGWHGVEVTTWVPGGGTWRLASPLVGSHQARNLALAAAAASALGVDEAAARRGARAVTWPGRLERLDALGRAWILDGAHNPAGARALAASLSELEPDGVDVLIVGVSADKDLPGVLAPLVGSARALVATRAAASARAFAAETIADAARCLAGDTVAVQAAEPRSAIARALERSPDGGTVLVAGSLFLVGETRTLLRGGVPAPGERRQ